MGGVWSSVQTGFPLHLSMKEGRPSSLRFLQWAMHLSRPFHSALSGASLMIIDHQHDHHHHDSSSSSSSCPQPWYYLK